MTTQKAAKLRDCIPSIASRIPKDTPVYDKTKFSMLVPGITEFLERLQSRTAVIVGIEAHICVSQTALRMCIWMQMIYLLTLFNRPQKPRL
jgi:nicotinamidase-related amidase